jgi:tetratricopeptide (TPR) repeat protein
MKGKNLRWSGRNGYPLILAALGLAVLVFIAFHKALDNQFVDWDDFTYVVNNDLVRDKENTGIKEIFTTPVSSNYHPLTILSMRLNAAECSTCPEGISPKPFIKWNIILHTADTILVLLLIYILTGGNLLIAAVTAVIFGIHPMHVESVAWISERKDVLYTFFFLPGLITYVKFKETGKYIWLTFSFVLFILSCLSKGMAVVFPVVLILINFWYDRRTFTSFKDFLKGLFSLKTALLLTPFFIVSLFFGLLAFKIQSGMNFLGILNMAGSSPDVVNAAGPFTFFQILQHAGYGFVTNVTKFFVPVNLSAFYPYPGSREFISGTYSLLVKLSPLLMLAIAIAALISARKTKLFAFGLGFFLLTIILVLQLIPVGYAITADRYTYLSYLGLAFIAGSLVAGSGRFRIWLLTITGIWITAFIFITIRQNEVWSNTESLWSNTIEKFPGVEVARRSRGKYYSKMAFAAADSRQRKRYEDLALEDFLSAVRSGSKNAEVYEGAGVIYGARGKNEESLKFLDSAIRLDSSNGSIFYNRALSLSKAGRKEEAVEDYTKALRLSPEKSVRIHTNRSNLLLSMGKFAEVIEDLDFLIKNDPGNADNYYNRAVARQVTNDLKGAIDDYRKVLEINPKDEVAAWQLRELQAK